MGGDTSTKDGGAKAERRSAGPVLPVHDTPLKQRIRRVLDDLRSEFAVTGLVLLYMLLVLVDLVVQSQDECDKFPPSPPAFNTPFTMAPSPPPLSPPPSPPSFEVRWSDAFNFVDLGFLCIFDVEMLVRLFAYGYRYFIDPINALDATIIIVSTVLQVIVVSADDFSTGSLGFLRIVRLIRLVRLFVVMNKVQKARVAYKRTKYLKLGSPVERVMELLADMKGRSEEEEDEQDITWIMQLIASDKLYAIDIRAAGGGNMSSEMEAFLVDAVGMKEDHAEAAEQQENEEQRELRRQDTAIMDASAAQEVQRVTEILASPEMASHLANINNWDLDIFDLTEKSQNSALVVCFYHLIEGHGLVDKFRISKHRLLTFARTIMDGYKVDTPYHNAVHALDVLLNTNYFMRQAAVADLITPLDKLSVLLAATIHDYQHPGLNNVFLQATKHEYAITYNDNSILESHHVAASWRVLLQEECNLLKGLTREQYLEVRDMVIQFVLGTDMKFHFEHCTKFKAKVASESFKVGCEREDVKFLLGVCMHTADIANPAKPMSLCLRWTELVMEEFFKQGDLERSLGMPISPFYDRDKTSVAQCQMGFINVLVRPLYAEVTGLLGEPALTECFGALEANLSGWETHGNELIKTGGK